MASTRIDWVAEHCQLLRSISAEFKDTLPFRGLTVPGRIDAAIARSYLDRKYPAPLPMSEGS
jgi:hypothetical protein